MSSRIIRTESELSQYCAYLSTKKLPFTGSTKDGASRSVEQNKLQRLWINELASQGDMTAEEYRAHNKLHFGVPILREESDEFCEKYDRIIKPLAYEQKLELMMVPFDFPVTRLMTSVQKKRFLDVIYVHWSGFGYVLTDPNGGLREIHQREATQRMRAQQ